MSVNPFLITLDEVLRAPVDTKNRGIRWGLSEQQVDLDYADDNCLLFSKASDMQYKLYDPGEESAKVGLKLDSASQAISIRLAMKLWKIQIPSPILAV